jgi:hypothetical protein
MAVELAALPFSPSAVTLSAPSPTLTAAPEDFAGTRFLHSIGWAAAAAVWGAWLGAMVESAVEVSAEARVGALIAAPALSLCGMLLALYGSAKCGLKERVGRALMEGLALSWQGIWLGALVGGGLTAASGGAWVIPAALGAVFLGGLIGLAGGVRFFGKNVPKILNGVVWGGVLAGFAASFMWTPSTASTFMAPVSEAASPIFGPSADWAWRTVGAAPLMLAAFVWWVRWMREERAKEKGQATGWGMGIVTLLFTAAMAAGTGALIGGLAQLGCVYLIAHVTLPPTPGTWLGLVAALFFWGLGQQSSGPVGR